MLCISLQVVLFELCFVFIRIFTVRCWQVKLIFGLTGGKLRLCASKDGTNELSDLKQSEVLKLHESTVFAIADR